MTLKDRIDQAMHLLPQPLVATAAKAVYGLPPQIKRVLVRGPHIVEGNQLGLDAALTLLLLKLQGASGLGGQTVQASRAAMRMSSLAVGAGAAPSVRTRELTVAGADGPIPARLYTPAGLPAGSPLVVFFHGGGFALGDLDTHDAPCRELASQADSRVLSVQYRLAPEAIFPAAADDAVSATVWAIEHAAELGADPARVAVCGDSAGGNLAAVTSRELARRGGPKLVFALLFYPTTGADPSNHSRDTFAAGYFLTKADMDWFRDLYTPNPDQVTDPKVDVLHAENLTGICPTHIVVCGFDPLRDEGLAYAKRLAEAEVVTTTRLAAGEIHGFINMVGVSADARQEFSTAVHVLKDALKFAN